MTRLGKQSIGLLLIFWNTQFEAFLILLSININKKVKLASIICIYLLQAKTLY